MKKKFILSLLFFFIILNTADIFAQKYPKRIISGGPAITEQLYLLKAEENIVGCTTYCIRPEGAKYKEKIGTVLDFNIEKILSLRADLVIATPLTNEKTIKKLEKLGIRVVRFPLAKNFDQLCEQFLSLARLIGKENIAQEIVRSAKTEIEKIKEDVKNFKKVKVFVQLGEKPLFTATADSFIDDFIKLAGGINIAEDAKIGLYSEEKVLEKNPDVIIIVGMQDLTNNIWKKYKTINAVKNNRIYILEPYKVCSPTPLTFVDTLKEFVKILHFNEEKNN